MKTRLALPFLVALTVGSRLVSSIEAQIVNGSFRGNVTDQSGAVITQATVKLNESTRGISRETTTDETGTYQFLEAGLISTVTSSAPVAFVIFRKNMGTP